MDLVVPQRRYKFMSGRACERGIFVKSRRLRGCDGNDGLVEADLGVGNDLPSGVEDGSTWPTVPRRPRAVSGNLVVRQV